MASGDVWRCAIYGDCLGQRVVNVWHIKLKSVGATVDAGCERLNVLIYNQIINQGISSQMVWHGWDCRQLAVPAAVHQKSMTAAGAAGGDCLPPQTAMVVTLRTGLAGRRYRGRVYLGVFAESAQANGTWDGAKVTAIQGLFTTMLAELGAAGSSTDYEVGVWSRMNGGNDPGPYNLLSGFTGITEAVVRSTVYSMRTRTIGKGI